ncbi:MAG: YfcE family phosphodiesterase [Clostridia bacterium]|nr:YfcE family phosphodiesterase [Clostridia bacterium]
MKTIVVFSDSHGLPLPTKLANVALESDYVFFLGDGTSGLGDLLLHKGFHAVRGNCDAFSGFPDEELVEVENVRFLLTHGHSYRVKHDKLPILLRAQELGANVALYGHTHFADEEEQAGVLILNPGAIMSPMIGAPSYAYFVVSGNKYSYKIVKI